MIARLVDVPFNIDNRRTFFVLFLILLSIQIGLFCLYTNKIILFSLIISLSVYIIIFFNSIHLSILLLLFLISVFQEPRYKFEFMPLALSHVIVWMLLIPVFIYGIIQILLDKTVTLKSTYLSRLFFMFFILTLVSFFVGIINQYDMNNIIQDVLPFLYYLIFYVVLSSLKSEIEIKNFVTLLLTASLMVTLEFLYSFFSGQFSILSLGRIVTGQIHVITVAFSFLCSYFLYYKTGPKILSIILLIPMVSVLLISQTRGTWIACIIAGICNLYIFLYFKKVPTIKMVFFGFGLLVLLLLLFLSMKNVLGEKMLQLVKFRFDSIGSWDKDHSLLMRASQNQVVWNEFLKSPLWGRGFGSMAPVYYWQKLLWIDNSYLVLLWKMGLSGFFVYISILIYSLKKSWYIINNTVNVFYRCFASGFFSAFSGFAVLGLISPVLIKYRFNLIWAVLFACIEYVSIQISRENLNEY